jgi:adenylate cyclase
MTRARHEGAAEVVRWMLNEGRFSTHMREFGHEMCRRIVDAGIPILRGFCTVVTLHPQIMGSAYIWRRGEGGANRQLAEHGLERSVEFAQSPIVAVRESRQVMRRHLEDPNCPNDFAIFAELKGEGGTDYLAVPMPCSDGAVNAISFLTDRAGGFTEAEIAGLEDVAQMLGLIVELQSSRRIAKSLLDTYVGRRTGERVLKGAIKRGAGETINAVIWFCDLRGFTTLADRIPSEQLTAILNECFEIMTEAVAANGGEVLKFVGDGMLAIFELRGAHDAPRCCTAALNAARIAAAKMQARNEESAHRDSPIKYGLARHLGEVYYGNIGAPGRLDFTVIGPAVNHASRLEKLGSELGRTLVTSASFAAAAPETLENLGAHQLRGVAATQEVFAPRPASPPDNT